MTTTSTPAALPATISVGKSNVRDFILAGGKGVPINLNHGSVRDFIRSTAKDWQINLTSLPRNLFNACCRAGSEKAEEAVRGMIAIRWPDGTEIPAKLPPYFADNAVRAACEAAEAVIRPWVTGNAYHTNPKRQEAGIKAAAAVVSASPPEPEHEQLFDGTAPVAKDTQEAKLDANKELANSEFESPVETVYQDIEVGIQEWLDGNKLRTLPPAGKQTQWACIDGGLTNESLTNSAQAKAALSQGLIIMGATELQACAGYAARNKITWPENLAAALEQQVQA